MTEHYIAPYWQGWDDGFRNFKKIGLPLIVPKDYDENDISHYYRGYVAGQAHRQEYDRDNP